MDALACRKGAYRSGAVLLYICFPFTWRTLSKLSEASRLYFIHLSFFETWGMSVEDTLNLVVRLLFKLSFRIL